MNAVLRTLVEVTVASGILWAATTLLKKGCSSRLSPAAHLLVWTALLVRLAIPLPIEDGLYAPVLRAMGTDAVEFSSPRGSFFSKEVGGLIQTGVVMVWIAGVTAHALAFLSRHLHLRSVADSGGEEGSLLLQVIFRQELEKAHLVGRYRLVIQRGIERPQILFPRVILFPEQMQHMSCQAMELALRHELTRCSRGDYLLSVALRALECVWWFNPIVWIAGTQIRADMGAACRHDAMRGLTGAEKALYERIVTLREEGREGGTFRFERQAARRARAAGHGQKEAA